MKPILDYILNVAQKLTGCRGYKKTKDEQSLFTLKFNDWFLHKIRYFFVGRFTSLFELFALKLKKKKLKICLFWNFEGSSKSNWLLCHMEIF